MGKNVTIEYIDDLDGVEINEEDVDTVNFSFRGKEYTLYLTKKNGAQFNKDIARYINAAKNAKNSEVKKTLKRGPKAVAKRPVVSEAKQTANDKAARPRKASPRKASAPQAGPERTQAIREWAIANGHNVAPRGRISAAVIEAFDAAH
ncbi:histone-like nucleoid-structuring protein Lsr2 [Mycolicibacterium llatzerense]|uniref:histone-like nucleoid-structuring protein Lsr2 n=1 Tax=Mycolicibacterium llatzerense TaxID=280871 RepID=UPI0008DDA8F4|nr:Lsr2 family protein [Mycolicibacterium llatzerense]